MTAAAQEPEATLPKRKTNPRIPIPAPSPSADNQIGVVVNKEGALKLQLSPALTEWLGRWIFRLVTIVLLGYVSFVKGDPPPTDPNVQKQIEGLNTRMTTIEGLLKTLIEKP